VPYLYHRVPIKFLGCWDTVGSLGVPDLIPWLPIDKLLNKKYAFHDAKLSPIVENAFHAVAIDEKRKTFVNSPMEKSGKNPMQVVEEVWFAGEHGCVGGGTPEYKGLSDCALLWMLEKAQAVGLEFYQREDQTADNEEITKEFQITPKPETKFDDKVKLFYRLGGVKLRSITGENINIHDSVKERIKFYKGDYHPNNLPESIYEKIENESKMTV
jgi:hypothetical protein